MYSKIIATKPGIYNLRVARQDREVASSKERKNSFVIISTIHNL